MGMKFVQVGINMQQEAETKEIAIRRFTQSCNICSIRGLRLDCDACPISEANKLTIAIMDDLEEMEVNKLNIEIKNDFKEMEEGQ